MTLWDIFFLTVLLTILSTFIFFIMQIFRGKIKWNVYQGDEFFQTKGHWNYYHHHNQYNHYHGSAFPDLQHRYSCKDEYNILNGRLPGDH